MLPPGKASDVKIPVTIVTGFLGAGKTTLLSRLVKECVGKRIAVIQNEVSEEMGIESAVLTDSDGKIIPDFFELPNGCICCTAKDDMVVALENIVNLGRERIDAIVVETTGIADPCTVAEIFWIDSELCSVLELDGIVAVVDCVNFADVVTEGHLMDHSDIGRRQVAIADRVLINKTDIASPERIDETRKLIESLNPSAEILVTTKSAVDASWVLDIGSFRSSSGKLAQSLHNGHHSHMHASTVDHVFISLPNATINRYTLDQMVGELIWEPESSGCGHVYRAKGLFRCSDETDPAQLSWYGLQAVGVLFETLPLSAAEQLESNQNGDAKFLFIGKDLVTEKIREKLIAAIVPSSPP